MLNVSVRSCLCLEESFDLIVEKRVSSSSLKIYKIHNCTIFTILRIATYIIYILLITFHYHYANIQQEEDVLYSYLVQEVFE